jgi:hypothetical protein
MRAVRTLSSRGYAGVDGERVGYVEAPTEYDGTSRQVCGVVSFSS